MKLSLTVLAFMFAASNAFANGAVTSLSARVATAAKTAKIGKVSKGTTTITKNINSAAALAAKPEVIRQAEEVVEQIEQAAKDNDGINGISKSDRFEALQMVYVILINNNGRNKDLEKISTGQLYSRLVAPSSEELGAQQFAKFINFSKLVSNGTDPEAASRQATGGSLAEFANNCGAVAASSRR